MVEGVIELWLDFEIDEILKIILLTDRLKQLRLNIGSEKFQSRFPQYLVNN